ncbi:MAG: hypothetical protein AAF694_15705 [Bacteroidota bacterium]
MDPKLILNFILTAARLTATAISVLEKHNSGYLRELAQVEYTSAKQSFNAASYATSKAAINAEIVKGIGQMQVGYNAVYFYLTKERELLGLIPLNRTKRKRQEIHSELAEVACVISLCYLEIDHSGIENAITWMEKAFTHFFEYQELAYEQGYLASNLQDQERKLVKIFQEKRLIATGDKRRRKIFIQNLSGEDVDVYLSYHTLFSDGTWGWNGKKFSSCWSIENGEKTGLRDSNSHSNWSVRADFIKVKATPDNGYGTWDTYETFIKYTGEIPLSQQDDRNIYTLNPAESQVRNLYIVNNTRYALKVKVAYRTCFKSGRYKWCNTDFKEFWSFDRGESAYLEHDSWRLNADLIKIWAVSKDGKHIWESYKDKVLNIGGRPTGDGGLIGDYTFTFT